MREARRLGAPARGTRVGIGGRASPRAARPRAHPRPERGAPGPPLSPRAGAVCVTVRLCAFRVRLCDLMRCVPLHHTKLCVPLHHTKLSPFKKASFARVWERPGYARRVGRERVICTARMWGKDFKQGEHARRGREGDSGAREAAAARAARAEGMIARGVTEVYTDGSGQGGAAGWGWVAVAAGREVQARRGPVVVGADSVGWRGAERATNNTGELTAVLEAIEWAIGKGLREVVIRYDSEYAAHMTRTSPMSDCTVPCHVMVVVHPEYAYSSAHLWADLP